MHLLRILVGSTPVGGLVDHFGPQLSYAPPRPTNTDEFKNRIHPGLLRARKSTMAAQINAVRNAIRGLRKIISARRC